MKNKPIEALYIHIPFCAHLCDYCDFPKLQYFRNFASDYLISLKRELDSYNIDREQIKSIYVGGGTPTALEDDLFLELLKIIKPYNVGVEEYTFEANPESLTESKIKLLKEYGVNRISLGVQSTDNRVLNAINRKHSYSDVVKAINLLQQYDITNINVDLILGLPHSSKKLLINDLERLTSLGIKHLSCYALTIHPHTVLFNKGYQELDDEQMREYYDIVNDFLSEKGFIHYEVSNWSKPGYESKHNYTYWRNDQYYGVGLGASGYIDDIRYKNTVNLDKYLKGECIQEKEIVTPKDKLTYQIMLNLRTNEGLDVSFVKDKEDAIKELISGDLLKLENNRLIPTYEGMMVLDQIVLQLIP